MKIIIEDANSTQILKFDCDKELIFGRSEQSDITLKSDGISRKHFSLKYLNDKLYVDDLNSKNGIYVNTQRTSGVVLNHGDILTCGNSVKITISDSASEENCITPVNLNWGQNQEVASQLNDVENQSVKDEPNNQIKNKEDLLSKQVQVKSYKKILAIIFLCISCALALVIIFALSHGDNTKQQIKKTNQYFALIDMAVNHLEGHRYALAEKSLQKAKAMSSNLEIADILNDYIQIFKSSGPRLENLNWDRAKSLCNEMLEVHPSTNSVQEFAQTEKSFLRKAGSYRLTILKLKRLYKNKQLKEAYLLTTKIPQDNYLYMVWSDFFAQILKEYRDTLRFEVQEAMANFQWQKAKSLLNHLKPLVLKSQYDLIDKQIDEINFLIAQQNYINSAQIAFNTGNDKSALEYLKLITDDSKFKNDALKLKDKIKNGTVLKQSLQAYNAGDIKNAFLYLDELNTTDALTLKAHMKQVVEMMKNADMLLQDKKLLKALDLWRNVISVETNKNNIFFKRAQKNITYWANHSNQAQAYYQWGRQFLKLNNIVKARKFFDLARQTDLKHNLGVKELAKFLSDGEMAYNQGLNLLKRDFLKAKKHLERALLLLPANHVRVKEIKGYLK